MITRRGLASVGWPPNRGHHRPRTPGTIPPPLAHVAAYRVVARDPHRALRHGRRPHCRGRTPTIPQPLTRTAAYRVVARDPHSALRYDHRLHTPLRTPIIPPLPTCTAAYRVVARNRHSAIRCHRRPRHLGRTIMIGTERQTDRPVAGHLLASRSRAARVLTLYRVVARFLAGDTSIAVGTGAPRRLSVGGRRTWHAAPPQRGAARWQAVD